jgi:hypothetical protein
MAPWSYNVSNSPLEIDWVPIFANTEAFFSDGEIALKRALQLVLPHHKPLLNYRHPRLLHSKSGRQMELDVYYKDLRLGFEYQGRQHFKDSFNQGGFQRQTHRDREKQAQCKRLSITLIQVPFWWNKSPISLAATIQQHRPEIQLRLAVDVKDIASALRQRHRRNKGSSITSFVPETPTIATESDVTPLLPASIAIPDMPNYHQKLHRKFSSDPTAHFMEVIKYHDSLDPSSA